jgi:hypothetical protein
MPIGQCEREIFRFGPLADEDPALLVDVHGDTSVFVLRRPASGRRSSSGLL